MKKEILLEQELKVSLQNFMIFTTNSNKTKLESDVFELDDLLRVSISNRWTSRENLTEKIDDIAMDIIDKTKK